MAPQVEGDRSPESRSLEQTVIDLFAETRRVLSTTEQNLGINSKGDELDDAIRSLPIDKLLQLLEDRYHDFDEQAERLERAVKEWSRAEKMLEVRRLARCRICSVAK